MGFLLSLQYIDRTMKPPRIAPSLIAGLGASMVHIVLMEFKHRTGILPAFEPYGEIQKLLAWFSLDSLEPPFSWLLPYVNGAMILGILFGQNFDRLPGRMPLVKGAIFGAVAWLVLGLVMLPAAGSGIFAGALGLGVLPAILMFAMLMIYAMVMSWLYAKLTGQANG